MKRGALIVCLYAVLALGLVLLAGCATTSRAASPVLMPVSAPCPAALGEALDAPARTLNLDVSQPGLAVLQFAAIRARWIGYADALKTKLDACK